MKNDKKKYFRLFSNCIIVSGFKRSGICDLQRGKFETVPNSLLSTLDKLEQISYESLMKICTTGDKKIIDEYMEFLISNEYGFWSNIKEHKNFPSLNLRWDSPHRLTNAIIDIDPTSELNYSSVFEQLISLAIPHIQIRSYKRFCFSFYKPLLLSCNNSRIKTIDLILPYTDENEIDLSDLVINGRKMLRVNSIIIYNSKIEKVLKGEDGLTKIIYTKQNLLNHTWCGVIDPSFFSINIQTFTESQNFNSCLNRKISIDVDGEIRNCPSMHKSFGNIRDISLLDAFNAPNFKDMWNINKDKIKVCQDCEYRHICTDCRAFIDDPSDIYSHPAKCSYNPYQAKWKDDESYKPVTEMSEEEILKLKSESF